MGSSAGKGRCSFERGAIVESPPQTSPTPFSAKSSALKALHSTTARARGTTAMMWRRLECRYLLLGYRHGQLDGPPPRPSALLALEAPCSCPTAPAALHH